MKNVKLWIGLLAMALVALLILRSKTPTAPPSSKSQPTISSTTTSPVLDPTVTTDDQPRGKKETEAERRARLISNKDNRDDFKLSEQDVYVYLESNHSNAVSLVTAFEATHDKSYLKIAAERFPEDPFVQTKALINDVFPAQDRAKWIAALKQSSPDNALPYLLAMNDAIKAGDLKGALADLAGARGKTYNDFTAQSAQGLEEAYLSAGRNYAEAKVLGSGEILLPHISEFSRMGKELLNAAEKSAAAGDLLQQIEYLKANWEMGKQLRQSPQQGVLITDLVGIAAQNRALRAWPADVPAAFLDRSIQDELAANAAARDEVRSIVKIFDQWFPSAPEQEVITYMDRSRLFGEQDALKWLHQLHPELVTGSR